MRGLALRLSTGTYVLIVLLPFLVLLHAADATGGVYDPPRLLHLIGRSFALAAPVAAASFLLALAVASFSGSPSGRVILALTAFATLCPPHVHLLSWARPLAETARRFGSGDGMAWAQAAFVQFAAFSPFAALSALLGARVVDGDRIDAARLLAPDDRAFTRIALPLLAPFASAGAALTFLMSLLDFSIPSHFQWNVLALEIFSDYSASGSISRAVLLSLPLSLLAAFAGAAFLRTASSALHDAGPARPARFESLRWTIAPAIARMGAGILVTIVACAPLVSILAECVNGTGVAASVTAAHREIAATLRVSSLAAVLAVFAAFGPARLLHSGSGARTIAWLLLLPPLIVPAPLVGVALIASTRAGPADFLYGSSTLPVLASAARFTPWAALLLAAQFSRRRRDLSDAAAVAAVSRWRALVRVHAPLAAPGIVLALLLVFSLSLGELGATILVVPAGEATLTLRLFNYLHYGAGGAVAGLGAVGVALAIVPAAAGYLLFRRHGA